MWAINSRLKGTEPLKQLEEASTEGVIIVGPTVSYETELDVTSPVGYIKSPCGYKTAGIAFPSLL